MKEELKKITGKEVQINIFEIKRPELDARLVADSVARQLEGRISFRRAVKMAVASTMRMGAEANKIKVAGRLGGAEMARTEMYKEELHFTHSEQTLTTLTWKLTQLMAESELRFGLC